VICPLAPVHFAALASFQLSALLFWLADARWAALPLALFVLSVVVAPFLPRSSYFLPVTWRGRKGAKGVALTFDDGPDPAVTPALLDLLDRHGVPAAFFMTGERAARHPGIVRDVLARGHEIGNHSMRHDNFLMLRGRDRIGRDLAEAQAAFAAFGVVPVAFRPPVGITNPPLWRVLLDLGMFCVNYSCRAVDAGNRRVRGIARRILGKVRPGDIVAMHDVSPRGADVAALLGEFDELISGLKAKGLPAVPLSRLLGKDVMLRDGQGGGTNPAERFYDGLAEGYDEEQFESAVSISRRTEHALFTKRLPELFEGAGRVLEIGAGTGIFTLDIARCCGGEVVAADISGKMLAILSRKAAEAGICNIRTLAGDIEKAELEGTFDVVCAFSALEYMADLPALVRRIAPHVAPGGAVYFITARTSFFRFWTQVGNAMRQGLWLRARTRREMEKMLSDAGFGRFEITGHLLRSWFSGGMLLEVVARKAGGPAAGKG
jgi:peptidoglycan/xylan/chitin deacetylase (PgdA/CDA1 family)/SAM-dependent methyltransferase